MTTKFAAYRKSFRSNPDAFMEGVVSFCKRASDDDEKGFVEKMLPWVFGIGGAYGAMLLGDTWGRHAHRTGNPLGPVRGPLTSALNAFLPKEKRIQIGKKPLDPAKAMEIGSKMSKTQANAILRPGTYF